MNKNKKKCDLRNKQQRKKNFIQYWFRQTKHSSASKRSISQCEYAKAYRTVRLLLCKWIRHIALVFSLSLRCVWLTIAAQKNHSATISVEQNVGKHDKYIYICVYVLQAHSVCISYEYLMSQTCVRFRLHEACTECCFTYTLIHIMLFSMFVKYERRRMTMVLVRARDAPVYGQ